MIKKKTQNHHRSFFAVRMYIYVVPVIVSVKIKNGKRQNQKLKRDNTILANKKIFQTFVTTTTTISIMKLLIILAFIGLLSVNTCQAGGGGSKPWEYIALYHLTGPKITGTTTTGDYTFLFYKQKGAYADATFDVSFGINSVEGQEGIEKAEPDAENTIWKTTATDSS